MTRRYGRTTTLRTRWSGTSRKSAPRQRAPSANHTSRVRILHSPIPFLTRQRFEYIDRTLLANHGPDERLARDAEVPKNKTRRAFFSRMTVRITHTHAHTHDHP